MAFAVDIMHGCDPSNEKRPQLYPKKTKAELKQQRHFTHPLLLVARQSALVLLVARCTNGEAFKRRLACSVTAITSTTVKSFICAKVLNLFKTKI